MEIMRQEGSFLSGDSYLRSGKVCGGTEGLKKWLADMSLKK